MISKAIGKYIRISPKKARLVADIVWGSNAKEALYKLYSVNKGAKVYFIELLKSAISNAKIKDSKIDDSKLFISKIYVDGGPFLVRFRAASMGRATTIRHRTSHICLELDTREQPIKKEHDEKTAGQPEKKTVKTSAKQAVRSKEPAQVKKAVKAVKSKRGGN